MTFLVDNCLSPYLSQGLNSFGYKCFHVRDFGLQNSSDLEIFQKAAQNRTIISADTDFSNLIFNLQKSKSELSKISLILFRKESTRNQVNQLALLRANLPQWIPILNNPTVILIRANKIRVRTL